MSSPRIPSLAAGLQTVVRLYPWSVLWILFAVGLALAVSGTWFAFAIILILILAVVAHSAHRAGKPPKEADHD